MRMKFFLYQSQLNVTIVPLNDRMPFLVTKNPSMVVVRGQSKSINRDMLEVEDPDTDPVDIRFNILDNGLQGKLVYADQTSRTTTAIITNKNMGAFSNGDRKQTKYRLIEKPKAGKLLVEDKQTNIFLQV